MPTRHFHLRRYSGDGSYSLNITLLLPVAADRIPDTRSTLDAITRHLVRPLSAPSVEWLRPRLSLLHKHGELDIDVVFIRDDPSSPVGLSSEVVAHLIPA